MDSTTITFFSGLFLLVVVILTNWKKASLRNVRRYKVTIAFGLLTAIVGAVASVFNFPFIGIDVVPWYSIAALITVSISTLIAAASWMWVHNKIVDESAKG